MDSKRANDKGRACNGARNRQFCRAVYALSRRIFQEASHVQIPGDVGQPQPAVQWTCRNRLRVGLHRSVVHRAYSISRIFRKERCRTESGASWVVRIRLFFVSDQGVAFERAFSTCTWTVQYAGVMDIRMEDESDVRSA